MAELSETFFYTDAVRAAHRLALEAEFAGEPLYREMPVFVPADIPEAKLGGVFENWLRGTRRQLAFVLDDGAVVALALARPRRSRWFSRRLAPQIVREIRDPSGAVIDRRAVTLEDLDEPTPELEPASAVAAERVLLGCV